MLRELRGYLEATLYSSICAVKSCGYEIVTSVIVPLASVTGVSFGITNPVYDGSFSASSTRSRRYLRSGAADSLAAGLRP